jgi:hypothetical protein
MARSKQNGVHRNEATDLPTLARRINDEFAAGMKSSEQALAHFLKAGRALLVAKGKVAHGEWINWIEGHLKCSARQANRYMALAAC